jgi:hypothetical protein
LTDSVIEFAVPKESNSTHRIIFVNPIDTSKLLLDSAIIQKANRKMAGVKIKAALMFSLNFFIVMAMDNC